MKEIDARRLFVIEIYDTEDSIWVPLCTTYPTLETAKPNADFINDMSSNKAKARIVIYSPTVKEASC